MADDLHILIEASIGLLGFSGITLLLSGSPSEWPAAERARITTMLIVTLIVLSGSLAWISIAKLANPNLASQVVTWLLALSLGAFLVNAAITLLPLFRSHDPTTHPGWAAMFMLPTMVLVVLMVSNQLVGFVEVFDLMYLALVWSLIAAALLFVRILLVRPGTGS